MDKYVHMYYIFHRHRPNQRSEHKDKTNVGTILHHPNLINVWENAVRYKLRVLLPVCAVSEERIRMCVRMIHRQMASGGQLTFSHRPRRRGVAGG